MASKRRHTRNLLILGALVAGGYVLSQRKPPARPMLPSTTQPASEPVRIGWAGNVAGDQWGDCC